MDARGLVESPLQLLGAVEAHAAGLAGERTRIHVRTDVPALDDARRTLEEVGLPDGLRFFMSGPRAAFARGEPVEVVGDAFSGLYQATSLRRRDPQRAVLLDDGLATVELARILATAGTPVVRLGPRLPWARRALGGLTARRLAALARSGRLVLFTAMPLEPDVIGALEARGVRVVVNTFAWLAGTELPGTPPVERTLVIGSGMVADGLVDADAYLGWLRELAADGAVRYFPHRRETRAFLDRLGEVPGVTVDEPGAPVELRLQGLRAGQRVVGLPSTSSVLLTRILGPKGVSVEPQDVPETWWTAAATPALRSHLRSVLTMAAAARTAQD